MLECIKNWSAGSYWDDDGLDAMDKLNGRSISWCLAHCQESDEVRAIGRALLDVADAVGKGSKKKRKRSEGKLSVEKCRRGIAILRSHLCDHASC